MTIASHTLVRNGQPFLELVLNQVEPYMDKMIITVSEKSKDGSIAVVNDFLKKHPSKVRVFFENVADPALLTAERQKQVEITSEDWILFLDDDDYWPEESLEEIMTILDEDIDALGVSPIQVINQFIYDNFWEEHKFFTKWFRNININYRNPWPKDIIFTGDTPLYWKHNVRTKRMFGKYLHLSSIKNSSFRKENWTEGKYLEAIKGQMIYPEWCKKHLERIYERLNKSTRN